MFYISQADVGGCRHVATRVHTTWQHLCVTRVRVCAPVSACVHVRVINGLKHS